jgi:hypothetical protein
MMNFQNDILEEWLHAAQKIEHIEVQMTKKYGIEFCHSRIK